MNYSIETANSLETKLSEISGSKKVIFPKSKVKRKRRRLTSLLCLQCSQLPVITAFHPPWASAGPTVTSSPIIRVLPLAGGEEVCSALSVLKMYLDTHDQLGPPPTFHSESLNSPCQNLGLTVLQAIDNPPESPWEMVPWSFGKSQSPFMSTDNPEFSVHAFKVEASLVPWGHCGLQGPTRRQSLWVISLICKMT